MTRTSRTAVALVIASLAVMPMSAESEPNLEGWYVAEGFDIDGTRYRALVALRRDAQSYRVTMFVSQPSEAAEPELAAIGVALQSRDGGQRQVGGIEVELQDLAVTDVGAVDGGEGACTRSVGHHLEAVANGGVEAVDEVDVERTIEVGCPRYRDSAKLTCRCPADSNCNVSRTELI